MSYWIPELQELIIDQVNRTPELYTLVQTHIYPKELAVVQSPRYPCISFTIEPVNFNLNVFTAYLNIWIWNESRYSKNVIYDIYNEFVKKFDHQRFSRDNKYYTFQRQKEPVELYDQVLEADYLAATWIVRGVSNV